MDDFTSASGGSRCLLKQDPSRFRRHYGLRVDLLCFVVSPQRRGPASDRLEPPLEVRKNLVVQE